MEDLSLHILDIAENSFKAGATALEVIVCETTFSDLLTIMITDNGAGMDQAQAESASDPFYTTRTTRRIGLGLALLREASRQAGGSLLIESRPGSGTRVTARFRLSHIDRQPLGSMPETITALIAAQPEADIRYRHHRDGRSLAFSSREIGGELNGTPLNAAGVLDCIRRYLDQEEQRLRHHQEA